MLRGAEQSQYLSRHTGWEGGIKNKVKELRSVCFVQAAFLPGSDSSSLDADAHEVGERCSCVVIFTTECRKP